MRLAAGLSWTLAILAILAHPPVTRAATFVVNSTGDAGDAIPGDRVCETAPGNGLCTLRAAADESAAQVPIGGEPRSCLVQGPVETTITFSVTGTIALGSPVSLVSFICARVIEVAGPGQALLTLEGGGIATGGFQAPNTLLVSGLRIVGADVGVADAGASFFTTSRTSLTDVTISDGRAGVHYETNSSLSLDWVTIVRNSEDGIGFATFPGLFVSVSRSEIADNGGIGIFGPLFTLGIDRSRIAGNGGDGLRVSGVASPTITITDTTFDDNGGAGAVIQTPGSWMGGTTVSNNDGGGIDVQEGNLDVVNSTISGNMTPADGGGVLCRFRAGALRLNNTTITANVADADGDGFGDGGGVFVETGAVLLSNSILADNVDRGGEARECAGQVTSVDHNVLGNLGGCSLNPLPSDLIDANPRLGLLGDNGGPTLTHAPLPGSPAIDQGSPAAPGSDGACAATDQRGVTRPQLAACDAGAVEWSCQSRCDPCEVCDPARGCRLPVAPGCMAPPFGSALVVKNNAKDPRDVINWAWKAPGPLAPSDVGSPLAGTSYTLCLIDARDAAPTLLMSASTPPDGLCDGQPCWTSVPRGFRYRDKGPTAEGLVKIFLHPSLTRKGRIALKGRGGELALPGFPLVPPVTVRLVRSDGPQCWEATFTTPAESTNAVFRARSE
jgi:hypothetical protein